MNKHIEFVKEWLADRTSKTQAELEANAWDARSAAYAARAASYAAARAASYAAWAATDAASAAAVRAAYWVKQYEEIVK